MTQIELNRAVASATGDRLSTVRRLGFSLLAACSPEPERQPLTVDWDELHRQRGGPPPLARRRRMAMVG
jgi:hypothetical protein